MSEWDVSDLDILIHTEEPESLTLEYKSSPALGKTSDQKREVSKDVSAFANSAGGVLIYGMVEDGHVPTRWDSGVDGRVFSKEWLENVIGSHIHPRIGDLVIRPIPLPAPAAPGHVAFALDIPAATTGAPHQASDHRYYKRLNFQSVPMEHYEVRDLMRRSMEFGRTFGAAWDLNVEMRRLKSSIDARLRVPAEHARPRDHWIIRVSNDLRSSGPALILLDKEVRKNVGHLIERIDDYNHAIETTAPGNFESARLDAPLILSLREASAWAGEISDALAAFLETEP